MFAGLSKHQVETSNLAVQFCLVQYALAKNVPCYIYVNYVGFSAK